MTLRLGVLIKLKSVIIDGSSFHRLGTLATFKTSIVMIIQALVKPTDKEFFPHYLSQVRNLRPECYSSRSNYVLGYYGCSRLQATGVVI